MVFCISSISHKLDMSNLWRMQNIVHRNDSLHLPFGLLFAAVSLVLYEHVNEGGSVRNYLAMNVMTMLPLAFLERKILMCTNPVSLISQASGSVLLLHLCFLALRVPRHVMDGGFGTLLFFNAGSLVTACILLPTRFGFRLNGTTLYQHRVAFFVVLFALMAAALTEGLSVYLSHRRLQLAYLSHRRFLLAVADTGALYLELLALMPAVLIACLPGTRVSTSRVQQHEVDDTQQKAISLLAFLIGFYFIEDAVAAAKTGWVFPLVATVHVIHFLLVVDFAGFPFANLYDPAKLGKLTGSVVNALSGIYSV